MMVSTSESCRASGCGGGGVALALVLVGPVVGAVAVGLVVAVVGGLGAEEEEEGVPLAVVVGLGAEAEEAEAAWRALVVGTPQRAATSSQWRFLMDSLESSCLCCWSLSIYVVVRVLDRCSRPHNINQHIHTHTKTHTWRRGSSVW